MICVGYTCTCPCGATSLLMRLAHSCMCSKTIGPLLEYFHRSHNGCWAEDQSEKLHVYH